jgi:DNA polymerase-3 subunit gamma/tau
LDEICLAGFHCGEMSELAEGARLEIACTALKAVPRVRIPLSPPHFFLQRFAMVYEVLARKWRPQVFQDVIGQEHVTQTLINAFKAERLAHAYLFSGPRGVGKTSVARILAKAMNCKQGEPGFPCNRCPSCVEITQGSSVDVQEIDGASNRGIDEIRELRENIRYMPSSSTYRIYIIDEVHMLTLQAFNALLKTLEEPPPHVKFIFATTEPHKVPVTILSRCQKFDFKRIRLQMLVQQLEKVTGDERIEISRSGLALIAREAEGSMRDAESLLDQVISYTGSKVEDRQITDILGIIDRSLLFETSQAVLNGSVKRCIEIVDQIYNYGYDMKEFYRGLMDQFRNLLVSLVAPDETLLDMIDMDREELRTQAEKAGPEKLHHILNLLIAREENLRQASHPRLVLETVMIKLCQLGEYLSFEELFRKIEGLEKRLSSPPISADQMPAGGQLSDPGVDWQAENSQAASTEDSGRLIDGESWGRFLKFLASKNRAMANVLKEWPLLHASADAVEIGKGKSTFSSTYFDEPERYRKLGEFCRLFFKKDMQIRLVPYRQEEKEDKPIRTETKRAPLPPPIQDVLDIFQGEVKGEFAVTPDHEENTRREKS